MQSPPLFLIEFNELCPALLQRFMSEGLLPNFCRFHNSSSVFTTDAGAEEPHLEPWIQWPTVHFGLSHTEHGIFHLGDGRRASHRGLATLLSDAGIAVGICGSMNTNYDRLNGYVIPDPWDKHGKAAPDWLQTFYGTVARQVQESSREDAGSKTELMRFGLFLARHGLTTGTARAVLAQLWQERRDSGVRWRRAMLLDRIQYDLFRSLNRRFGVRFATFFCNSTAHFQHYYWRNMEPESFPVPPPATDHASLRDAIREGYVAMDRLLGGFLHDYPEAVLILCTALSQQAWTDTTKCTFRPRRFETLLEFAGVPGTTSVKPVMAEQFHVECDDGETAEVVESRFRELMVDDEPVMAVRREGKTLFAGCRLTSTEALNRPIIRKSGGSRNFGDLFYLIHTVRSGRHHPDGILWVRNGRHEVIEDRVPLTDIAPTVLAHFGVPQPDAMRGRPLLI